MTKKELDKEQIEKLVKKAQAGDTDSFGELYDYYVDGIYKYIFFKVDRAEALDLTENVFLKTWENIKKYKKIRNKYFSSWLYRIAHNLVVDYYRMRRESVSLKIDVADDKRMNDPIVLAEQALSQEVLRKAISQLKHKYQQIIIYKYINGLNNREIGKIMGRSEGNLRILKFRALKSLRQILEEMNINY
jgi:RNA polymerase sigma-70 factor (ECF subfamily)